jgi:hypothetical protein
VQRERQRRAWQRQVDEWEARGIFVDWSDYPHLDLVDRWGRQVDVMGRPMEIRNGVYEHVIDPIDPVVCPGCGEEFLPERRDQQYHGNACRQAAFRRRRKAGGRDAAGGVGAPVSGEGGGVREALPLVDVPRDDQPILDAGMA